MDGRDGASGQRSDPLKTLKRAASKAQPGDSIYFQAGRYERPFEAQGLKALRVNRSGLAQRQAKRLSSMARLPYQMLGNWSLPIPRQVH